MSSSFPPPSFDSLTLAAVLQEVRSEGLGLRVSGVVQPSIEEVVLALRTPGRTVHLLTSIRARTARVHLVPRPTRRVPLTSFGQLLHSRLTEARLADILQPPFDRVLHLRFDALGGRLDLVAEIMGRHSNLALVEAGRVVGALKVVTDRMSPRRPLLPGRPYVPPPADRPSPAQLDADALRQRLLGDDPLERVLTQLLRGFGPVLAREVALRAGVDPLAPAASAAREAERLAEAVCSLCAVVHQGSFEPVWYESDGRVVAFAPVPLLVYERLHRVRASSMSEALDRYYAEAGRRDELEDRRRALGAAIRSAVEKREAAAARDREQLAEAADRDRLRLAGELLLTYGHLARPRATSVVVPDHTSGGASLIIPLDPDLSPAENAARFFRRYAKARAASRVLPARIAHLKAEARRLREALVLLETATSPDDIDEVRADLVAAGLLPAPSRERARPAGGPRRFRTEDGALILVGRSARENDHVTFHVAGPDDLWFHARGMAGAHVVLKSPASPSEAAVRAAAQVAAYFSEGRSASHVAVDCVPRRRVRKPPGAPPGAVTYAGERTLQVAPALPVTPAPPAPR